MAEPLKYIYTVLQETEPASDDKDYDAPQTEELGIFESLEDANERARQSLESLGLSYEELLRESEVYYDDNGCLGMVGWVGEDNISINVKKKMIIPSRSRTAPRSPITPKQTSSTPPPQPITVEKHTAYKVSITILEDEQDNPYDMDTWTRTTEDTYFWDREATVEHIVAEVLDQDEDGAFERGHVTLGGDGLAGGVVEIDERPHGGNLKEVRYEVTREELEFVKRPGVEKRMQENQVEIVKTVWFGDVKGRPADLDGTEGRPMVIE